MSRTFRRLTAVMILALLAGAGAVQALPVTKVKGLEGPRFENPLLKVWTWIVAVVTKGSENTVYIDPNGNSLVPDPEEASKPGNGTAVEATP
jgi:hypothetical protein